MLGTSALALPTAYDGTAGRHPGLHEQDGHSEARHWDDGRHRRREPTTALR